MNNILKAITFKTLSFRKNYDIVGDNDNIITEGEGVISLTRIPEQKPPITIGEYSISIWNLVVGQIINTDFNKLIKEYELEPSYSELYRLIKNKSINLDNYDKLVIIHSFIIAKKYRKLGILDEFSESLYRDFYSNNTLILAYVRPIQHNEFHFEPYLTGMQVSVREKYGDDKRVSAYNYYSLSDFESKNDLDIEGDEYRVFSVAKKCGFDRINDSYLFKFIPDFVVKKIITKFKNL